MKNKWIALVLRSSFLLLLLPLFLLAQKKQWEAIGPEGGNIASLVQDPANPNTMYAVPYGKPAHIFRSVDHGMNWLEVSTLNESIVELKFHASKPGLLYALSSGFSAAQPDTSPTLNLEPSMLYFSKDGGTTWDSQPFPPIYAVLKIVFDPKDASTIHALARTALSDGLVYLRSVDNGDTWDASEILAGRGWGTGIAVDPINTDNIYVAAYPYSMTARTNVLYKSSNGGKDFSGLTVDSRSVTQVNDVLTDPQASDRVFVATYYGVFRSSDGGKTWQKNSRSLAYPSKLWINPKDTKNLIAKVDKGVAESVDGGVSWSVTEGKLRGSGISTMIVESRSKTVIFVSNSAGIFKTTDKGKSWKASHTGILATQVTSLRLAPSLPNTLLAGLMSNTVFKTKSAGAAHVTWDALPVFYSCTKISDIVIDTKDPGRIFALGGGG